MKRISLFLFLLSAHVLMVSAQSYRDYIRRGNRQYRDSVYDKAQVQYQKGFQLDSNSVQIRYNLGNALLYQGQPKEAMQQYERAAALDRNPVRMHRIYHNMGVILQSQKQFAQAIQAYVMALQADPTDNETRYNLVLCQYQLQQDPNGQGGGGGGNDKQDKQEEQKQQQQKPDQNQQKQQEQQKAKENEMSKENAEQMLNAAMQNERQTQDKVKKQQQQSRSRRLEKQW